MYCATRCAVLVTLGILSCGPIAFGKTDQAARNIWAPATVSATDQEIYSATLPTGRKISPVGTINGTPNFPTMIAAQGKNIAVLANGATPFQTITLYNGQGLRRLWRLAVFPQAAPRKPRVRATPGGSGIALNPKHTGAAGVVYIPKDPPAVKILDAKATLAAESNPHPVQTKLLSHSDLFQGLAAGPGASSMPPVAPRTASSPCGWRMDIFR